jgi:hypothetical protein
MAPVAHASTQALQSMQSSAFTTATSSGTVMEPLGQASSHDLQAVHRSLFTTAGMVFLLFEQPY